MSALQFLTFKNGILVAILSILDDLFPHLAGSELTEVSIVVSAHFLIENNCFWDLRIRNENILEKGETALAEFTKFSFNQFAVPFDQFKVF